MKKRINLKALSTLAVSMIFASAVSFAQTTKDAEVINDGEEVKIKVITTGQGGKDCEKVIINCDKNSNAFFFKMEGEGSSNAHFYNIDDFELGEGNIDTVITRTGKNGEEVKVRIKRFMSVDGDKSTMQRSFVIVTGDSEEIDEERIIEIDIDKEKLGDHINVIMDRDAYIIINDDDSDDEQDNVRKKVRRSKKKSRSTLL